MQIVKLRTSMGVGGVSKAGEVLDIDERHARAMIMRGLARPLEPGEIVARLGVGKSAKAVAPINHGKPGKGPKGVPVSGPLELVQTSGGFRIGPAQSLSSLPADPAPVEPTSRKRGRKGSKSSASTPVGD